MLPMLLIVGMIVIIAVLAERHPESRALLFGLFILVVIAGLARGFYWNLFAWRWSGISANRVTAAAVFMVVFYATFGAAMQRRMLAAAHRFGMEPRHLRAAKRSSPALSVERWTHVEEEHIANGASGEGSAQY